MCTLKKQIISLAVCFSLIFTTVVIGGETEAFGASAKTIAIGNSQHSGSIDYYGDGDLYTFTLNSPSALFIYVESPCPEIGFGLKTEKGQYISVPDGNAVLPVGKYFVEVIAVDCNDDDNRFLEGQKCKIRKEIHLQSKGIL